MGKLLIRSWLLVSLLFLTSCDTGNSTWINKSDSHYLFQGKEGYSTSVPLGYSYSELSPDGKYFYFGYPATNQDGLGSIEFHTLSSCTQMGVTTPATTMQESARILEGKIDFFDTYGHDYEPLLEPVCRPLEGGAGYALCSEYKGKFIVVCIIQRTDNPALAKQIFETFRWTD